MCKKEKEFIYLFNTYLLSTSHMSGSGIQWWTEEAQISALAGLPIRKEVILRIAGGAFAKCRCWEPIHTQKSGFCRRADMPRSLILCMHGEILLQALGDCAGGGTTERWLERDEEWLVFFLVFCKVLTLSKNIFKKILYLCKRFIYINIRQLCPSSLPSPTSSTTLISSPIAEAHCIDSRLGKPSGNG